MTPEPRGLESCATNTTRLRPGMCFSDEPRIYASGEMAILHEEIIFTGRVGGVVA